MKHFSYLVTAALLAVGAFTSCSKDDDPQPQNRYELLAAKSWRITALSYKEGNNPAEDLYAQSSACDRDDFYKFNSDKTFIMDEGASRCDPNAPQTRTGAWDITADGAILLLLEMKGSTTAELYDIAEISGNKLRIRQSDSSNGAPDITEITFTAF